MFLTKIIGTFTFTFTKAGSYAYHCDIHLYMKATIVVKYANQPHSDELRGTKVHHCSSFDLSYMFPVLLLDILLTTFTNQCAELKFSPY
jgi:hypothetical protein